MFFHCSELYAFSGFYCGWRELAQKRIGILQAHFCAILSIVHNGGLSWLLFSGFRDLASLEKSVGSSSVLCEVQMSQFHSPSSLVPPTVAVSRLGRRIAVPRYNLLPIP